jgi:8-oxo-dGTP pyrophosphatase MutT (NUDIX family)
VSETIGRILEAYTPRSDAERRDVERVQALLAVTDDPWTRAQLLHVTGSAIVVHPPSQRVLLRWHARMQGWLQVGGHGDPGESDPFAVAVREAREETGLSDLTAWPDPLEPRVVQVAIVPVPAGKGEPPHEHADIRYALQTTTPDAVQPEDEVAQLRWLSVDQALEEVGQDNLRVCLSRIASQLRK